MNRRLIVTTTTAVIIAAVVIVLHFSLRRDRPQVVINEAVRTLLYLPLYHAIQNGHFADEGIEVQIVTGGTATNSFAAMLSGEADFSQADPMYVPIANQEGARTKVVAQIVARIAVWGVALDTSITVVNSSTLVGRKISTHPRPMTAYTYAAKTIRDHGLTPDIDVEIIQGMPGTELVPLLTGRADLAFTLEPQVSTAVSQGAHVVVSYPELLGDQVFTGLMTREAYIQENRGTVVSVVRAIQAALQDIYSDRAAAVRTAVNYFPQVPQEVLVIAVERLVSERVFPITVAISEESWDKAVRVRVEAGDLKSAALRRDACAVDIMEEAVEGGRAAAAALYREMRRSAAPASPLRTNDA